MTPERLDLIRERLDATGYAEWKHACRELLAEVDRLRDGVEAIRDEAWEPWLEKDWQHLDTVRDDCNALLNPDEGDDR